ncbi:hypothetical protein CR513_06898, partial [Mucuna pruriens]
MLVRVFSVLCFLLLLWVSVLWFSTFLFLGDVGSLAFKTFKVSIMASGSEPTNDQQKKKTPSLLLLVVVVHLYHQRDLQMQCSNPLDKNNRNNVTCDFCLKSLLEESLRAKRHQLKIRGDVGACRKIPENIKLELNVAFEQKK